MTNVVLYSTQPVLAAGLQSVLATVDGFALSGSFTTIAELTDYLKTGPADLLLVQLTMEVTLGTIIKLKAAAGNAPVVLWVDAISCELASQAIGQGVRGILRKTLPMDLQVKCLQKVAAGELWLEEQLSGVLLRTKRIALSPRERDLMALLAQGFKNREIAEALGITQGTVKVYLSRLFQKVGANDRFELALFALKNISSDQASGSQQPRAKAAGAAIAPGAGRFFPASFVCIEHHHAGVL